MNKNLNKKNAFLTDVEFQFEKHSKSQVPKLHVSRAEEKNHDAQKLPLIISAHIRKNEELNTTLKQDSRKMNEIDSYIDNLPIGLKKDQIEQKSRTRDFRKEKHESETFNKKYANNFLTQQRQKIEQDITAVYTKKSDNELENFIKNVERSTSFQQVLETKEEELIRIKKIFNAKKTEVEYLDKKILCLDTNIQKLKPKEDTSLLNNHENKNLIEIDENSLDLINNQTEILENMKKACKDDIIVLLKKNLNLKEFASRCKEYQMQARMTLKRQEEHLNQTAVRFLDMKKNKNIAPVNETINSTLHKEFAVFEETIKYEQIIKNEEKIQKTIEMKEREIIRQERLVQLQQIEELKTSELKLIERETKELNYYKSQIYILVDRLEVTFNNAVFSKFNELKTSINSLNEMRINFESEISLLEFESKKLKETFESIYISETTQNADQKKLISHDEQVLLMQTTGLSSKKNPNVELEPHFFENNFALLDELRRNKNQELCDVINEYQKFYKIFLDCASTISRILYQLNPLVYKSTHINTNNIMNLFTQIGLHLEKMALQFSNNEDSSILNEDISGREGLERKLPSQPPDWIRLKKCEDEGDNDKNNPVSGSLIQV